MIKRFFFNKVIKNPQSKLALKIRKKLIDLFHIMYYHNANTWLSNKFLGYNIEQNPFDMQLYQEIIFRNKPCFILQTGVNFGGSVLYFCHLLDIMNFPDDAKVIGIDIILQEAVVNIKHPRLVVIEGSSTDASTIEKIEAVVNGKKGMVILDSDHSYKHVFNELKIYQKYVDKDQYLVVEDTNLNANPVASSFGPGPLEAANEFLKNQTSFVRDNVWERNLFSFHQKGWLKHIN